MLKFIKKMLIKWSLNEIMEMHESQNSFGDPKDYGIDEIIDFSDGNFMIGISKENSKQIDDNTRKEHKAKLDIVE